jgi:hypothetical protein
VRVLPPQSPNSPPDSYTDKVVYVTAMYQARPGAGGLNYALAHDKDDHFDFIMAEQRLEAAPAVRAERLGMLSNTGADFLDRIEKAVRS